MTNYYELMTTPIDKQVNTLHSRYIIHFSLFNAKEHEKSILLILYGQFIVTGMQKFKPAFHIFKPDTFLITMYGFIILLFCIFNLKD